MLESISNRIAYLRGLAEGLDVNEQSAQGRLIGEMIEILDDMHAQFGELHARVEEAEEYVEAIDEDLEDVELYLYGDDEDLYEPVVDCSSPDGFADLDDDEEAYLYETADEDHLETTHEFECPSCRKSISVREGRDEDGFHHFIIEPSRIQPEYQPINPT